MRPLHRSAELLRQNVKTIEEANAEDLKAAPGYGLMPAEIDRLKLNRDRVEKVTPDDVKRVAAKYLTRTNRTVGMF